MRSESFVCTGLSSDRSPPLTGSSRRPRPADAAALGARQQRLPVVLAGPAVTGVLLGQVLLGGSLQVELLQTCTLHFLHKLVQRTQLDNKFNGYKMKRDWSGTELVASELFFLDKVLLSRRDLGKRSEKSALTSHIFICNNNKKENASMVRQGKADIFE
ncbi:hypothetical protein FQN60_008440 [Etheostoma spectabile]|uniref:Uncharacterized protein n=1 Tax=Etheostoma spectabile TaxID=54343 RepID=A0A5J5CWJ5_9PERO|nr:hypothetical protein FQN60_008440 [Etheostoma spectabile]